MARRAGNGAAKSLAVLFSLLIWQAAALLLDRDLLLVSPVRVLIRLSSLCLEPHFWNTIGFSFQRIVAGFLLGLVAGTVLAIAAGRSRLVEYFLWPSVVTIKSVPVASFIVISLIWLSSRQLSVFISFLMVLPVVYSNVLQGIRSADKQLLEMAAVFRVPWRRRLLYIDLPHIRPFLTSACSVALGLSWKAGIAAEVIGIPDGSIGEQLYNAKIYVDTADLFAWTVVIVAISVLFEKLFLWLLRLSFDRLEKI
jgi:NitT/TauT family transport system permease protein